MTTAVTECIVCSNLEADILYEGILRCTGCGYVFADLSLSDDELFELYSENYFAGEEYRDYVSEKDIIQKNFRLRYDVLSRYLDAGRHNRLFEIGSAYGFFLDLVRDDFETVSGIDVTKAGVQFAREELGLDVALGDFLDHEFAEKIDIACMWDTIEHLRSPHLYLEKIAENMDSGGILAITTGDIASVPARLRGRRWRLIHPPTHAHYFSRVSLEQILARYGFEILYNRYCGFYRSTETIAYVTLVLRQQRPKLFDRMKRSGLLKFDLYLNFYDIMYAIARKR